VLLPQGANSTTLLFVVFCITKVSTTRALLLLNTLAVHLPNIYSRHIMFADGRPSHEFLTMQRPSVSVRLGSLDKDMDYPVLTAERV
jgi:hypothetical protein